MAYDLLGKNFVPPDVHGKVTGKAKYAEDFRAEGMVFVKLMLSPMPHARVRHLDTRAALATPGVKAILTADDLPDLLRMTPHLLHPLANLRGAVADSFDAPSGPPYGVGSGLSGLGDLPRTGGAALHVHAGLGRSMRASAGQQHHRACHTVPALYAER